MDGDDDDDDDGDDVDEDGNGEEKRDGGHLLNRIEGMYVDIVVVFLVS